MSGLEIIARAVRDCGDYTMIEDGTVRMNVEDLRQIYEELGGDLRQFPYIPDF